MRIGFRGLFSFTLFSLVLGFGRAAEGATLRFERSVESVMESDPDVVVTLRLEAPECDGLLRVPEAVATLTAAESGSATGGGIDFRQISERIPIGVTGASPIALGRVIAGLIVDDPLFEGPESFELSLELASGARAECLTADGAVSDLRLITGPPAVITIEDDDLAPVLRIVDVSLPEGGPGGSTSFGFRVTLSEPLPAGQEASVSYNTAPGTAVRGTDYQPARGRLSFEAGQGSATVRVDVLGDDAIEPDETFFVELSDPIGAEIGRARAVGTIENDDVPALGIDDAEAREGESDLEFRVFLRAPGTALVSVDFRTMADTAEQGADFEGRAGRLTFAAGETEKTVVVRVRDDEENEATEQLFLGLENARGADLSGETRGRGTILDNDEEDVAEPSNVDVVSGDNQIGRLGEALADPLVVAITDDQGLPAAAGVAVSWELVEGAAIFAEVSRTDDAGLAENRITLGSEPGEVVIVASIGGTATATFNLTALATQLEDAARPVGGALIAICAQTGLSDELLGICDDFRDLAGAMQNDALRAIAPEEAAAQGTVSVDAQSTQLKNLRSRLEKLRAGTTASAATVALDLGGVLLTGDMVADLLRKPARGRDEIDVVALFEQQAGRTNALGQRSEPATDPGAAGSDSPGRLGFHIEGRIGEGDQPRTGRESGLDLETQGLTAGVDYRVSDRLNLGVALGYLSNDVDLGSDGGELDVEGYSLSLYGLYTVEEFYVDAILSYGENEFDMRRAIEFPGRSRQVARAQPDGEQLALGLGIGYDGQLGAFTVGGFARFDLVDAEIDAYREVGAPGFNLDIEEQSVDSLLSHAGVQVTYALSLPQGVLLPTLRFAYLHEFEDDSRPIVARFVDDPSRTAFAVDTDEPDRDYFNLGLGLSAVFRRGRQAFLFYEQDLSRDDLDFYLISAGLRFEF